MASKNNCTHPFRLSEDLLRRLYYIADAAGQTPNNYLLHMLRQNIAYFERTHGKIRTEDLQKIVLEAEEKA